MDYPEIIILVLFILVCGFVLLHNAQSSIAHMNAVQMLSKRTQVSDANFDKEFSDTDLFTPDLPSRCRKVIALHLKLPKLSIYSSDDINGDLAGELDCDPHLHWKLMQELGLHLDKAPPYEEFQEFVNEVTSVSCVVEYCSKRAV